MIYEGIDRWSPPDSYLEHYGVKGMKWGVRHSNYSSHDSGRWKLRGTFSHKGKHSKPSNTIKYANKAFKPGKDGKPSPAEKITRSSGDAINSSKNILRMTQSKKRYDTSKMSDDELRRRINRIEMEHRYNSLMNSDLSPWRQKVSDILDVTGNVLAIGASAAAIGTAVYQIKKG